MGLFRVILAATPAIALSSQNILTTDEKKAVTTSLSFHQKLLVCNACPGWEGVDITRNGVATTSEQPLAFNECRRIEGKLYPDDRIEFNFKKEAVSGTFAIDTLPESDSQLLLIVQKRGKDDLLSFQSFAFPPSQNEQAQVAVLNTIPEDSDTRVKMSDAMTSGSATREEEVLFNRVYGIQAGTYDLATEHGQKKPLPVQLTKNMDYVILKTGTKEHSQLMLFPSEPEGGVSRRILYSMALMGPLVAMAIVVTLVKNGSNHKEIVEEEERTELVV